MKRILAVIILSLLTSPVFALLPYEPKFIVTPPTTFTDGSVLNPLVDIASLDAICGSSTDMTFTKIVKIPILGGVYEWQTKPGDFPEGDYFCGFTVTAIPEAGGKTSDSYKFNFSIVFPPPIKIPGTIIEIRMD